MEPEELQGKRIYVGLLSGLFLAASGTVSFMFPEKMMVMSSLMRVGTMLGVFWLSIPWMIAHPRILKFLPWYLLGGIILVVVFIRYLWATIPILIALAVLSMFARKKRPDNKRTQRD